MNNFLSPEVFAGSLFVGMLLLLEAGRRLGTKWPGDSSQVAGRTVVESAIFALFGLLVAFTFSSAITRFDSRRMLIADESNNIGTAYLRLDLLVLEDRAAMQQMFRDYLDSRLEVYRLLPDVEAAKAELQRSGQLQSGIWTRAVAALKRAEMPQETSLLLLPALNDMFDITTTRTMAARSHPPSIIYALLFMLGLGCALVAGNAMASTRAWSWSYAVTFAAFIAISSFVIIDIEFPRTGFIRLTEFDSVLVDLRNSMK